MVFREETLMSISNVHMGVGFLQSVFFTFGYMDPDRAPIVAEMLGFNPELVMPQLLLQLQAAEQAQALQQQESGQEQQHQ